MEETSIRIGNESYEKLYGSFGLTTLKDKHVNIKGGNLKFSFKGKKWSITYRDHAKPQT
jgi:DNA topoisomerase-1